MFHCQVLTEDQAATELVRPNIFGPFNFQIRDVEYALDATGATCPDMEFLCLEFSKGDDPDPLYPQLPFTVVGVVDGMDETPAPENLIGCTPFPKCEGTMNFAGR